MVQAWVLNSIRHHLYMSDCIFPVSDRDMQPQLAIFQLRYLIGLVMIKGSLEVTFALVAGGLVQN